MPRQHVVHEVAPLRGRDAELRLLERARAEPEFRLCAERAGGLHLEQPGAASCRFLRARAAASRRPPAIRVAVAHRTQGAPGLEHATNRARRRAAMPPSSALGSSGASLSNCGTLRITSAALRHNRSSSRRAFSAATSAVRAGDALPRLPFARQERIGRWPVRATAAPSSPQTQSPSKLMPAQVAGSMMVTGARSSSRLEQRALRPCHAAAMPPRAADTAPT